MEILILTASSYICEITPPSQRGPLTTGPQLLLTFGLLAGYFICYGTANLQSSLSWRTPFIVLSFLSVLFSLASALCLVQSPRWLILRGQQAEAAAAWDMLQVDGASRENQETKDREKIATYEAHDAMKFTDVTDSKKAILPDNNGLKNRKNVSGVFDAFSADVRARTFLAIFIMSMQQLSGIDDMLYVSRALQQLHRVYGPILHNSHWQCSLYLILVK